MGAIYHLPYAVITGTGATDLASWVDNFENIKVDTRFGVVYVQRCQIGVYSFWHVNRHCATRPIEENAYRLAHLIKHSARCGYILALALQAVKRILAISCVGGVSNDINVKDIVLPHSYLTPQFCPLSFSDLMPEKSGSEFYREWPAPFDETQRRVFEALIRQEGLPVFGQGLLEIIQGPMFETIEDMADKRHRGIDIVGMATTLPEAPLAGELGIPHQPACIITDHPDKRALQSEIETIAHEITPRLFKAAFNALVHFSDEADRPPAKAPVPVQGLRERLGL